MKKVLKKIKPLCFGLVIIFMVWGLWALREQLSNALNNANWTYLGFAALIALIYLFINASVWGLIVRLVGVRPKRWKAAALWVECEAMRWLPGGIWGYASRVVEAKRIGLNKTNGGITLALELVITVLAWGTLGLIGTLFSERLRLVAVEYLGRLHISPLIISVLIGAGIIAVVILLVANPFSIRTKLLSATSDLRKGLGNWHISLQAFGEYLLLSVFYSLGFLMCMKGIGITPLPSLLEAGGSYGIAWIVGFLAFGAPGGMGVREGFLFLVFEPLGIGSEIATAAILWRAIQIITELLLLFTIKVTKLSPQAGSTS